jgi:hypothetical protein
VVYNTVSTFDFKNKVTEIIVPAFGAGAPQNNDGVTRFERDVLYGILWIQN